MTQILYLLFLFSKNATTYFQLSRNRKLGSGNFYSIQNVMWQDRPNYGKLISFYYKTHMFEVLVCLQFCLQLKSAPFQGDSQEKNHPKIIFLQKKTDKAYNLIFVKIEAEMITSLPIFKPHTLERAVNIYFLRPHIARQYFYIILPVPFDIR